MSDFIAQIKGELSLQDAETRMQSFLNKYKNNPLKIKLDIQQSTNNAIMSQMKSLGKSAGKAFSQGMSSNGFVFDELKFARQQQKFEKKISKTAQRYKKVLGDDDNATRWATDYHNRALKEQEKAFNNQLKMQERAERDFRKKLSSAKSRIGSGEFDTRSAKNKSFLDQYTGQDSKALTKARNQIKKISELQEELTSGKYLYGKRTGKSLSNSDIVRKTEQLDRVVGNLSNTIKQVGSESSKTLSSFDKIISANKIQKYYTTNTKLTKDYINILKDLESRALSTNSTKELSRINKEFRALDSEISAKGLKGRGFFDEIGRGFRQIGQFVGTYGLLQKIPYVVMSSVNELKEMDSILTEISKTSELTNSQLKSLGENSFENASKWGKKASDYLLGIQEMSRSGYQGKQAEEMANLSVLAQAAGDLNADMANNYLLASNAAYQYQGNVEKLNALLDGQNMITNRNSVSMKDMSEATSVAASMAAELGIKENELSAMIGTVESRTKAGGSEVGNALKSLMINVQNINNDKIAGTFEKAGVAQTEFINGAEKMRSPIEIFKDLAKVFNSLEETDPLRTEILTNIGQKHQANKLSALLSGWSDYEKMLKDYDAGMGSASVEAEKSSSNWQGSINKLSNSWTALVQNFANSDGIITATNALDGLIKGIDKVATLPNILGLTGGLIASKTGNGKIVVFNAPFYKVA